MEHSFFGPIESTERSVSWSGEIAVKEYRVPVDMRSDGPLTAAQLDAAADIARNLSAFDDSARIALSDRIADPDTVGLFIDHHLSELSTESLRSAFGTSDKSTIDPARFLDAMVLQRAALRPASPQRMAVLDYTLVGDVTQYVLAVTLDHEGRVADISMES